MITDCKMADYKKNNKLKAFVVLEVINGPVGVVVGHCHLHTGMIFNGYLTQNQILIIICFYTGVDFILKSINSLISPNCLMLQFTN